MVQRRESALGRAASLVFTALVGLYTLVLFLLFFAVTFFVWSCTAWWDRQRRVYHYSLCCWCRAYVFLVPMWGLRVEGRANLPPRACVLTPNHQSFLDIIVLFCLFYPFKWVARSELFKLPLFGWILHLGGYVSIRRGSSSDAARMLAECGKLLEAGMPVLIFPEGTRSKTGKVGRFKAGAFILSARHGVPIVPIAMHGALETVKGGFVRVRRVVLRLRVLPPVKPPADETTVIPTRNLVEQEVREAVEALKKGKEAQR